MQSPEFEISIAGAFTSSHTVLLPNEIVEPFINKGQKRVKVVASFQENSIEFYAALIKRQDRYYMMFSKNNQKALGIYPNDYFTMQFFEDTSKYGVEMPEEFEAVLLSDHDAHQIFEGLTSGKKRGIIYAISRYKSSQTRIDKSLLLCENLKRGIRENKELLKPF
ncbi:MAG: YdeI/OmpD-associated family protein [Bacteroidota bacterium]